MHQLLCAWAGALPCTTITWRRRPPCSQHMRQAPVVGLWLPKVAERHIECRFGYVEPRCRLIGHFVFELVRSKVGQPSVLVFGLCNAELKTKSVTAVRGPEARRGWALDSPRSPSKADDGVRRWFRAASRCARWSRLRPSLGPRSARALVQKK